MSLYDVIFNRVEKFSSDANVSTSPTEKTTVVGPVHQADIARVEAESPEDAEAAVRTAYNASTSEVGVHEVPKPADTTDTTDTTESVESTEQPAEPVSEKSALSVNEVEPTTQEPVEHVDAPVQVDAPFKSTE